MNSGDGDKWGGVDGVHYGVDAFEKSAHASGAIFRKNGSRGGIKLAQISAGGKNGFARAGNNADGSVRRK